MNSLVGRKAPDFKATGVYCGELSTIKLSEYIDNKYVILLFYPLNFTFVCPTEITAFSDRFRDFDNLSTEILGISVDSEFSHLTWTGSRREDNGVGMIKYPLVSDIKKQISSDYGVLTDEGIALRATFIIDKKGIVQHSTINNLEFGRSVDEIYRTLQAIQHCQKNQDEVCPVNWKYGEQGMKNTRITSRLYFDRDFP